MTDDSDAAGSTDELTPSDKPASSSDGAPPSHDPALNSVLNSWLVDFIQLVRTAPLRQHSQHPPDPRETTEHEPSDEDERV